MNSVKGLRAVITGASSGIGEDYARLLAERGAHLVLAARRKERLEKLASELTAKHGVTVECVSIDLAVVGASESLFKQATAGGKTVEILVNNAGLGAYGPFMDRPLLGHRDTMQVNMVALTELTYLFVGHMLAHKKPSYISNVGSIAAYQNIVNFAVYCGSKSYVRFFTEALALELAGTNVRVSALHPGGTWTEFMEHSGQQVTKAGGLAMMSSQAVARIGVDGMLKGKPSVVPGWLNKLICFVPRLMPSRMGLVVGSRTMAQSVNMVESKPSASRN